MAKSRSVASSVKPLNQSCTAELLQIDDGDTFVVRSGLTATIRTACIDCPEIPHSRADAARNDLVSITQYRWGFIALNKVLALMRPGDSLTLNIVAIDRYRRNIAEIKLSDGRDLGLLLVELGLGAIYEPYLPNSSNPNDLMAAQLKAKQEKTGIWSESPAIMMPWEFRS